MFLCVLRCFLCVCISTHLHPCYLEIGWCIHVSKFWFFKFSYKRLLLSWLLFSYLSFLLSQLLLHSCKNFMFFYNIWLLHSYYNMSPTQHLSFCLCFNLLLLWCVLPKFKLLEKGTWVSTSIAICLCNFISCSLHICKRLNTNKDCFFSSVNSPLDPHDICIGCCSYSLCGHGFLFLPFDFPSFVCYFFLHNFLT